MVINTNARLKHLFAQTGNRDSDYTSYKNTVRFNTYIQKNFPNIDSSTMVLRIYYILLGIQIMAIGFFGFLLEKILEKILKELNKVLAIYQVL